MIVAGLLSVIVSALFLPGIILRTKSIASGRKGPGILQPYRDIAVLLKKDSLFSNTTGPVFRMAPAVSLAAVICASFFIPLGKYGALFSFDGDFIFFSYILAFGKFFSIIAALDTGSSFEGMGANREAFFSMLIEPAFFILMSTFIMATGNTSFKEIYENFIATGNHNVIIFSIIGVMVLLQIALIETSRVPVDDPKTHLELTMIHEVMILDNCGFDKALIHITTYLKMAIFGLLIFNVTVPFNQGIVLQSAFLVLTQILFAVTIGLVESFRARNKMNKNPKYILTVSAVAWIAFAIILIMTK